jgi:hypothetical protein
MGLTYYPTHIKNNLEIMAVKNFDEFKNSKSKITEASYLKEDEMEGAHYKQSLLEMITMATEIESIMTDDMEIDSWVKDKITIAHHNMDAILGYLKGKK